jgi:hypothetical protein
MLYGKLFFSTLYGMYTITLTKLKAVSAQAKHNDSLNNISSESTAQDDDFREVEKCKRRNSDDTSQLEKNSTKTVPISAAFKLPQKAVSTRKFFAPLRTTGMDTETAGAENNLPVQESPIKSYRPPPILMTSTTNLIQLRSDLKEHVKGEYEFRNTRNGTRIITKETLPLFLVTLTRNLKSQEIFKLNSLNHIIVNVEPYRAQTGLKQCYICQNFDHVWANCKQPPRCLRCVGGHLHGECPEKTNAESTPRCCNCTLIEGEKPQPTSYRDCSHAKGEQQWRKAQRAPKGFSRRTLFAKFTSAEQSYAAALRQETQQQQPQAPQTDGRSVQHPVQQHLPQQEFRKTGLSIHFHSSSDNDKLKVATVVRQIMRELNEALSEEDRVMIVTLLVLDLMQRNVY